MEYLFPFLHFQSLCMCLDLKWISYRQYIGESCFLKCSCVLSHFSHVQLFASLWTEAYQAPLSMGLSRKGYWSGLPCPPPGDLPDPGIFPTSLMSLALAGGFFITSTTWEAPKFILDTHKRERNPNTKLKKVIKPQGKGTRKKEEKLQKQPQKN